MRSRPFLLRSPTGSNSASTVLTTLQARSAGLTRWHQPQRTTLSGHAACLGAAAGRVDLYDHQRAVSSCRRPTMLLTNAEWSRRRKLLNLPPNHQLLQSRRSSSHLAHLPPLRRSRKLHLLNYRHRCHRRLQPLWRNHRRQLCHHRLQLQPWRSRRLCHHRLQPPSPQLHGNRTYRHRRRRRHR